MKVSVVIGSNLGDEGKGTVVASLTKHSEGKVLNVLTNGGCQRGHSIIVDDKSYTFHHFGSGSSLGADNYYSKFFILNPLQFVNEYHELNYKGNIYIHPLCSWSTHYDMMANQIIEEARREFKHGSCGMGIWETLLRENNIARISFSTFNAFTKEERIKYLNKIKTYYENVRFKEEGITSLPRSWHELWNSNNISLSFISACDEMSHIIHVNPVALNLDYDHIIFENGQGLLLDDNGTDIDHTTPSRTGIDYVNEIIKNEFFDTNIDMDIHYVTRPYLTRHGAGDFSSEVNDCKKISLDINEDRTNHWNTFQDNFRYGLLDIKDLNSRIQSDFKKSKFNSNLILDITHCDEMDRTLEFKKQFNNIKYYDSPIIQ